MLLAPIGRALVSKTKGWGPSQYALKLNYEKNIYSRTILF